MSGSGHFAQHGADLWMVKIPFEIFTGPTECAASSSALEPLARNATIHAERDKQSETHLRISQAIKTSPESTRRRSTGAHVTGYFGSARVRHSFLWMPMLGRRHQMTTARAGSRSSASLLP